MNVDREIIYASQIGSLDRVRAKLDKGTDPNIQDRNGFTALWMACNGEYLDVVKELLSRGANPNITDYEGVSPLYLATFNNYPEIIKELLLYGADPNIMSDDRVTPLYWATFYNHSELIKELLLYGADPSIVPDDNLQGRNREVIEILKNYFHTLRMISTRCIRKQIIDISKIPDVVLQSS